MRILRYFWKNRSLVVLTLMLFAVRWSFADHNYVPSGSMEPTLQVGDHLFVNKMAYDLRVPYTNWVVAKTGDPERGDVVVFFGPKDGMRLVKRVVGLPGDHLVIRDGFISVNGNWIPGTQNGVQAVNASPGAPVTYHERWNSRDVTVKRLPFYARHENLDVVVPQGEYFAMGDNRDNSSDSRVWGFFKREDLSGRVERVIFNLDVSLEHLPHADLSRLVKDPDSKRID